MNLGNLNLSEVYLGSTPILQIYLGGTLLWSKDYHAICKTVTLVDLDPATYSYEEFNNYGGDEGLVKVQPFTVEAQGKLDIGTEGLCIYLPPSQSTPYIYIKKEKYDYSDRTIYEEYCKYDTNNTYFKIIPTNNNKIYLDGAYWGDDTNFHNNEIYVSANTKATFTYTLHDLYGEDIKTIAMEVNQVTYNNISIGCNININNERTLSINGKFQLNGKYYLLTNSQNLLSEDEEFSFIVE